jgi:hypothetical protein
MLYYYVVKKSNMNKGVSIENRIYLCKNIKVPIVHA